VNLFFFHSFLSLKLKLRLIAKLFKPGLAPSTRSQRSNVSSGSSSRKNSLVHHWPLNGNLKDLVSGANLTVGKNAGFTRDRNGNKNGALALQNGFLQAPPGVYFEGNLTISAWVKVNSVGNFTRLLDFGSDKFLENVFASLTWDSFGKPYFNTDARGIEGTPVIANRSLKTGVWEHLVFTLDDSTSKIYINGQLVGEGRSEVPRKVQRNANFIGWTNAGAKAYQPTYADADLSDLKIFNRALNRQEVLAQFNQ
jgi:hypothetical protein